MARDGYVIETLAGIDARGRDSVAGDIWATMVRLHEPGTVVTRWRVIISGTPLLMVFGDRSRSGEIL